MLRSRLLFIFLISLIIPFIHAIDSTITGSEPLKKVAGEDAQLKYSFVRKWGSFGTGPNHFVLVRYSIFLLILKVH